MTETMQEFHDKQLEDRYNQRMIQIKALEKLEGSTQIIEADTAVMSYADNFRGKAGGFRGIKGLIGMMFDKIGYHVQVNDNDLWFGRYGDTGRDTMGFSLSLQKWIAEMPDVWPPHIDVSPTVDDVKAVAMIVENGVLTAVDLEEFHERTLKLIRPIAHITHHHSGRTYYANVMITDKDPGVGLIKFATKIQRALKQKVEIVETYNDDAQPDIGKPAKHCVLFNI